ncbi:MULTISPECIES: LysR family transcriptional regulator [Pseudomonas]|uniref:LysR family transcriptional regulator n=3 Tax=Pseudomonas TaxID=286 RepID=A0A6G6ISK6_PSENT|nr:MULTISPECIES: LysR substrate-binding domain-containing protein [Pseudomonas]KYO84068.1 Hca operon transcriptional activator [Pseudomonas aeruginosa]NWD82524.1 LysR family transcriptional regulator [Pseudomonas reactans]NWE87071.1 LysR family transcriptional regulator [Pseudomonas reactans]QIE86115.1 LysR family transcriptional regulator [Pseudomonas nitroreducens]HCE6398067.1 LysR family transcriptional regulator [Pseudomonas aeruginosa]
MRIRHLRYFLIVADELSFSRAAARVHIEPSPLSRAIKELEAELGVRLFQRTKGRIRLTWAGEVFREEAYRMLTFMEGARTRVHAAARGFRGRLRIGLTDSLAQPRLTRLLARCREEEPLTEVRIFEMTVKEMMTALSHDQIDAGFTVHPEFDKGFVKKAVWTDRPVIAIPRNHPLLSFEKISPRELARHALIICHPESCSGGHNAVLRGFFDFTLPLPTIAEYVSGHEPMMMLVAAGYGIGLGLESQITLYSHPDVIIRPFTEDVSSTATFITMLNRPPSEELGRFVARAQEVGEVITSQ